MVQMSTYIKGKRDLYICIFLLRKWHNPLEDCLKTAKYFELELAVRAIQDAF